jgi:hypothetical protein
VTSLAAVKALLGIPASDTSKDAMLTILVDAANRTVLDVFGLTSAAVTSYTDRIDVDDDSTAILLTRRWPLVAVTSVTEQGAVLASSKYSSNELGAIKLLTTGRFWAYGRESVVVVYTAGWSSVPADLAYAAGLIAAFGFNTAPKVGLQSERIGQYSYTLGSDSSASSGTGGFGIPPEAERILASWRRVFTLPN